MLCGKFGLARNTNLRRLPSNQPCLILNDEEEDDEEGRRKTNTLTRKWSIISGWRESERGSLLLSFSMCEYEMEGKSDTGECRSGFLA